MFPLHPHPSFPYTNPQGNQAIIKPIREPPVAAAFLSSLIICYSSSLPAAGPDLIISSLSFDNVQNWGSETPAGEECTDPAHLSCTAAFSIGTVVCNVGDEPAFWIASSNEHPVIRQGIYRLRNNQFEQLGTSWVGHEFLSANDEDPCDPPCINPGTQNGSQEIRPGCASPESASSNGNRTWLGPASAVNAFTGFFPYPPILETGTGKIANRIQVAHTDLDRNLNEGARYFAESQYITADEAQAGNGENNAAYIELDIFINGETMGFFTNCGTPFCAWDIGQTSSGDPAIRAWPSIDPSVRLTDARVPDEGLFIVGAKVTDLGTGYWRYEYAVHNLNSDRSGQSFQAPIPCGASVTNIGFHDVNHHSGEPWDTTDWTAELSENAITWSTDPFDVDPNANALRWSTLYNFRFDVDAPPEDSMATLTLFKPGTPDAIGIPTTTPRSITSDCNNNGIIDSCEIDSGEQGISLSLHYVAFQLCLNGPSSVSTASCCAGFDIEQNETIDLKDFAEFQSAFTGE